MDLQRLAILAFVWFLIFYQFLSFMIIFVPILLNNSPIGFGIQLVIFLVLFTLLCISYYKAIRTQPGSPSTSINDLYDDIEGIKLKAKEEQAIKKQLRKSKTQHAVNIQFDEIQSLTRVSFCFKCNKIKQVRVHHCKICKKCIARMDHHCPWVGNCVGKYNHKFFVQFLFYATSSLLIVCLTIAIDFFVGQPLAKQIQSQFTRLGLYVCCVSSGLLALSIGFLLVTQLLTISKNLTTLQSFIQDIVQKNPWKKESFSENMGEIFGKSSWILPTRPFDVNEGGFYDSIQI